jgi:hypothetical protein
MSMHANPGVYALLLGSGVSRAAKIPTGWEVVLDLARKLATLVGEECEPDPAAWYRGKFGRDPDYAELLDAIGKTPTERQQLLRAYFEPSADEREQGFKQPTRAHRAIAKLVASGHCRVIVTTNFDRLIERAIEEEGISPTVISTPDAVEGALPLVHQRCCIIKSHGDYLDVRIKNTPVELAEYDDRVNRLLDQVLDSFGLIVCGWSAQWDCALRAAIERCQSRRFTTYWASRRTLNNEAKRLVEQRAAQVVSIDDADGFFGRLAELVTALKDSRRQHPASIEAAVALTKRYLADPRHRIELADLVANETEAAHRKIETSNEEVLKSNIEIAAVFQNYRDILEILQAIMVQGAVHGTRQHDNLWVSVVERITRYDKETGTVLDEGIRQYPAVHLTYAAGLVAIARGQFEFFKSLLLEPKSRRHGKASPLLAAIDYGHMRSFADRIEKEKRYHTPVSEYLFSALREPLRHFIPGDTEYEEVFDRFEYLRSLVYADLRYSPQSEDTRWWVPLGRFCWKAHEHFGDSVMKLLANERDVAGIDWPPLSSTFAVFDGWFS